jgi:polyphenol oxidase
MPTDTIKVQSEQFKVQSRENVSDEILAENGFYWREKNGVKVLICAPLEASGFTNGFSTRTGGVSAFPENSLNLAGYEEDSAENIAENRRRFLNVLNGGDWRLASCWQVHSDLIRHVKSLKDAADGDYKMDALVSDVEGVLLGVKTADCVPVLLGDIRTKAFAAVHAGWRGTVASIVPKTIEEMRAKFGTNPADLIAAIGPAASCKNYEVGADVIELFRENFSENYVRYFTPTRDNHAFVNLHLANREQLLQRGVLPENIYAAPFCTMERTDLFFSYRVEKKLYGKTGRLMSVIGRRS